MIWFFEWFRTCWFWLYAGLRSSRFRGLEKMAFALIVLCRKLLQVMNWLLKWFSWHMTLRKFVYLDNFFEGLGIKMSLSL